MELKFEREGPSSNRAMSKKAALSMMIVGFIREASKELSEKEVKDLINAHAVVFSSLAGGMSAGGYSFLEKMLKGIEDGAKEILEEINKNETV